MSVGGRPRKSTTDDSLGVIIFLIVVAGLALRGAWAFIQDVTPLIMPFLIFIDTVGR